MDTTAQTENRVHNRQALQMVRAVRGTKNIRRCMSNSREVTLTRNVLLKKILANEIINKSKYIWLIFLTAGLS